MAKKEKGTKLEKAENSAIINNIPHCHKCGCVCSGIVDEKCVIHNGETYTEISRRCSNDRCNAVSKYCIDSSLNGRSRMTFNEVEEIAEEIFNY